jgi:hypothetical protein
VWRLCAPGGFAMVPTVRLVLLVLAVVCFALAAAGVPSRLGLQPTGLMLWALAELIAGLPGG